MNTENSEEIVNIDCKGIKGSISERIYHIQMDGKTVKISNFHELFPKMKFSKYMNKVHEYTKMDIIIEPSYNLRSKFIIRQLAIKSKFYKMF
jgi:hypothetical protein